jgi:hypothetical protein
VIPEPQRTFVLELIAALGSAANDFILARMTYTNIDFFSRTILILRGKCAQSQQSRRSE